MNSVLIIADLGHASPRIPGIASFLKNYGWMPTIITPKMTELQKSIFLIDKGKNLDIVETKYFKMEYKRNLKRNLILKILKKLRRVLGKKIHGWMFQYPDSHVNWERHVIRLFPKIIKEKKIELILSSSSPVSTHIIAKHISEKYCIPWVADLRDLWTQNHNYNFILKRKIKERKLELETLQGATVLTTVTPQWRVKLMNMHSISTFFVPNGYFSLNYIKDAKSNEILNIVYTGQIYKNFQNLSLFTDTIKKLINEKKIKKSEVKLFLYGESSDFAKCLFYDEIPGFIVLGGIVSREQSYKVQRDADLLLLLNWEDSKEKGVAPTKLYEYMATKNPIIATGGYGNDYVEDVLKRTRAGVYCKTQREIEKQLLYWIKEKREYRRITLDTNIDKVNNYSYENIAKRVANIFHFAQEKHK